MQTRIEWQPIRPINTREAPLEAPKYSRHAHFLQTRAFQRSSSLNSCQRPLSCFPKLPHPALPPSLIHPSAVLPWKPHVSWPYGNLF
ncbi:hypothetical protein DPEC_G00052220 [Dallia pectoralis]|uniref:Uncharacterized protein n=1 Tax=Dallia pectoralis TaxID=75939 RepID=A0ACC2HBP7_DALPE|nr:hypothetical protein DPEC_G00052220 [Dallia pectoralis]